MPTLKMFLLIEQYIWPKQFSRQLLHLEQSKNIRERKLHKLRRVNNLLVNPYYLNFETV